MTTDPIDWPRVFAERLGHGFSIWDEVEPGCWVGYRALPRLDDTGPDFEAAAAVVVAQGAVSPIITVPLEPNVQPTAQSWLRMHDALADSLRTVELEVGCAADGCEYDRWPCPVRVAGANPHLVSPDGWQDHYPRVRTDG